MSDLLGYRRANETWGVRNHVLVMPAQAAASTAAEQLAAATYAFRSPFGLQEFRGLGA